VKLPRNETWGLALMIAGLAALVLFTPGLLVSGPAPLAVLFGWGAPAVVVTLLVGGVAVTLARKMGWQVRWGAAAAGELLFLALLTLVHLALSGDQGFAALDEALAGQGGGLVGWAFSRLLVKAGSLALAWGVTGLVLAVAVWLLWRAFPPSWTETLTWWAADLAGHAYDLVRQLAYDIRPGMIDAGDEPEPFPGAAAAAPRTRKRAAPPATRVAAADEPQPARRRAAMPANPTSAPADAAARPERAAGESAAGAAASGRGAKRKVRPETLPPLDLLNPDANNRVAAADTRERAQTLKETLAEFGVPVEVVSIKEGPTVTQFGLEPGEIVRELQNGETLRRRVSVATIMRLSNDLALALAATSLRIEAPVPGRPYVGIEIPNTAKTMVPLRGLLESKEFARTSAPLMVALGRDVAGDPVLADLTRMPHLLIAGATGSGKSVCINAIVCSLLMNHGPDEVRFLMVDPKMVELPGYNGIPHLLAPVVIDPSQATAALAWLTLQMDDRYRAFAEAGVRNIEDYNRKVSGGKRSKASKGAKETMPYLVLVIDELADLMMTAADDVERRLCRLAQMARATGIHLVLATQRPSVDVITGLIKANFPARIAFAVTSQIDSRVILDSPGAEKLLGRGDMLFMAPDSSKLARIQGCFVSDREIERVVEFWTTNPTADQTVPASAALPWAGLLNQMEEKDDLLEKALKLLATKRQVSTSLLQRQLRIGFPRAARLMEQLEEMGAVGPEEGGGRSREVLLPHENGARDQ
jgi:S-DNA-T family DNA segregation ATPase FtsK/SpoIIIE